MKKGNGKGDGRHVFRLYVAGSAPRSARAVQNLKSLCDLHLRGGHQVDVVDVLREPARALEDGILVTPTLVRLSPGKPIRIVGDLSDTPALLAALGLPLAEP